MWTVGLSLTLLNAGPDASEFGSGTDIAGLVLFIIGLVWEAGIFMELIIFCL